MAGTYYGDYPTSATVNMVFDSFTASTGASSATSNFVAGDVLIYKDLGTTQRSSSAGITASTSFDGQTGLNAVAIDTSDNTDAGFYAAGHEYQVGIADITIDSQTVRFWLGTFSIERAGGILALIKGNAIKVDVNTIKTQSVTLSGGITFPAATVASTTNITTAALGSTERNAVADALLDRDMAAGADSGSTTVRTVRQALRILRNAWSFSGSIQTITKEDDATASWTQVVTTSSSADPIVATNPAGP